MKCLGFDIATKFPTLQHYQNLRDLSEFKDAVEKKFTGLLIYHGIPNDPETIASYGNILELTLLPAINEGRCAVLIIDTVVIKRHDDCLSPYIHFYSAGVPNVDRKRGESNPLEPRFQDLIDKFASSTELPDESTLRKMWAEVDPFADRLMLLRLLEEVLYGQKGEEETLEPGLRGKLLPLYGSRMATFSEVRKEYLLLCGEGDAKKKINRWQAQREITSHQTFHHGFYALLSRPGISRALEDPSQPLPEKLKPVLRNWYPVRDQLEELLKTAVPNAIASCELELALMRPDSAHARTVIEDYAKRYGTRIEALIQPVVKTTHAIHKEVDALANSMKLGNESEPRRPSHLLDLCGELSAQLSKLKMLESIGEGHE